MCKKVFISFLVLFASVFQVRSQGLKFSGENVPISDRSSYQVFGGKKFSYKDSLSINFKFMIFPYDNNGNILRVSVDNTVFCLTCQVSDNKLIMDLNKEGCSPMLHACHGLLKDYSYKWMDISILFRSKDSSITFNAGSFSGSVNNIGQLSGSNCRIVFGKEGYVISIPSFAIKDLHVAFDQRQEYFFPLNESDGVTPRGSRSGVKGLIENPKWLAADNWHWHKVLNFSRQEWSSSSYSSIDKSIYSIYRDSVCVVNYLEALGGLVSTKTTRTRCPVDLKYAMTFPDSTTNSVMVYNFKKWNKDDSTTVASYSINSRRWRQLSTNSIQSYVHKPAFAVFPDRKGFILFGGLSVDEFTNTIYEYSFDTQQLRVDSTYVGDIVSPRYFSCMGVDDKTNSYYLYGGVGNETGRQISGKLFYYDCYKIDISNKKITKLWESEWDDVSMVPIQSSLIKNDCIYTLCYQTYLSNSVLQLYEFNLSTGANRKLGDGIPIISDKRAAHAELYFDDTVNHLIAFVYDTKDSKTYNTSVYALNWPPKSALQVARENKRRLILIVLASLFIIATLNCLLVYLKNCRKEKTLSEYESVRDRISKVSSLRKNAIYLFGTFTVIDSKGEDITSCFSPKLKEVLILIISRTVYSGGISSAKLSSLIWPDYMWENSKNIRNVTISSLRKALSGVDGFKIDFEDEKYRASIEDTCFCDLAEYAKIYKNPSRENVDFIIGILNRGAFLKDISTEVSDELKVSTENEIIDFLEIQMPHYYQNGNYARASYLARILLETDPVHEKAIAILIKSYRKLNKQVEAVQAYQEFAKEYQRTFNEKYAVAYKSILLH